MKFTEDLLLVSLVAFSLAVFGLATSGMSLGSAAPGLVVTSTAEREYLAVPSYEKCDSVRVASSDHLVLSCRPRT